MIRPQFAVILLFCAVSALAFLPACSQQRPVSFLIVNGQLADGTGAPLRKANVRVAYNHIVGIGELEPEKDEPTIDAKGLVLAPGFIDIHNHSDEGILKDPLAETQIGQGITSLIVGADGDSPWPIVIWVRSVQQLHTAPNISLFAGHSTIRQQVMGRNYKRAATPQEIGQMEQLLGQAMNQQALGLSSGLGYDVGSYSDTAELVALARMAAERGGIYMTQIRDEADKSFEALNEEIAIAERAHIPVEHSHIKLGTIAVHGKAAAYITVIDQARRHGVDFMADCYPYDAWHANPKVLVPDKQYENAKNITQSMLESDIKAFYQQPWVMVASDGGIASDHPRGAGTFPRVLGLYVREKHWLTLPEAIRKMTSLPAQRLGWKDRGIIREGAFADLVLFNPDTVIDRSTYADPTALPVGIEKVFVNGVLVWDNGKPTSARPGLFLGRAGAPIELLN